MHGDWYVGKGVASAVVDHPVAGLIEVFNTHVSDCNLIYSFNNFIHC
jgi:hypothetical protein